MPTASKKKKLECQIKDMIYCRGTNVRRYVGTKRGDPEFNACWTCVIRLKGQGLKFKETSS